LLPHQWDLQIRRPVGRPAEWAAVNMLAAIEKQVMGNIDQVMINVSFGVRQPERLKGLPL
jgi:hypothetical protein